MKIVSNELKIALKQPTTQRKGRILVNGNYYEVYNVEYYADAYNEGNVIGNAIASQLDFDLPYMDKFETFKYYDGVWTGAEYEYVDMGTFTVFDEQDEDEFNKHITAFDNLIKFNQPFQDVGGYPKTLYQELENICSQAEVELQNASIPNGNFIVENNQFVEGENLKTVLKAIEQISGTYGIIKNDNLVLQLKNQTTEEITKNEHEPITWKRRSYGINQVILGMEDVQGEYVLRQDAEDIAINGVHKLVINDNPFIYTQQKREEVIDELFNQVKGFGYVPYDLKMEWLNYMDIGDTITIDDVETLILRMYGKSPKSLESEISAPAIIDSAIEYSNNTSSLSKRVSRTEFSVDKNAREIQAIVETTETIQKEINPTKDESGSEITIEDASNNSLTYLEIEGKSEQDGTPTPDAPVEIESVGYENLFDGEFRQGSENVNENFLNLFSKNDLILSAGTYTFSCDLPLDTHKYAIGTSQTGFPSTATYIGGFQYTKSFTFTLNEKLHVGVLINGNGLDITPDDIINYHFQITKGTKQHSYIPYGKYGIEVKTTGRNIIPFVDQNFDLKGINYSVKNGSLFLNGISSGETSSVHNTFKTNFLFKLNAGKYTFSHKTGVVAVYLYDENNNHILTLGKNIASSNFNLSVKTNVYIGFYQYQTSFSNVNTEIMISKQSGEYEPHQSYTSLILLNEPLRSLPNGVADKVYIKNNRLYVDRYVSELILDGSESWLFRTDYLFDNYAIFRNGSYNGTNYKLITSGSGLSNYFNVVPVGVEENNIRFLDTPGYGPQITISKSIASTENELKTWLSTHNTKVDYELAEPYTEELDEIETLVTFKGYNQITTTDELKPIINLTYVRDTVIADYVEQHVAELKINEDQIRQSVETVNSSVDGLTAGISRVEQITTDNSQVLNIISTNIDKSTGEVREVTTTTGFTFNAEGSSIKDSDGFEVLQTPKGAYYKDNGTITGQYTKDGSKQKDLELFGTYSYGKTDIDDTPMFVGQLYTDENGEETFGHFYNGGDY